MISRTPYLFLFLLIFINENSLSLEYPKIEIDSFKVKTKSISQISLNLDKPNSFKQRPALGNIRQKKELEYRLNKLKHNLTKDNIARGDREGNGGNFALSEFMNIAYEILNSFPSEQFHSIVEIDIYELKEKTNKINIECKDNLELRSKPVNAINYPRENLIELDCVSFLKMSRLMKEQLVLHELLYFISINDNNYYYSSSLLQSYRSSMNFDTKRTKLYESIMTCDINTFNYIYTRLGQNLSNNDNLYITPLDIALTTECPSIANILIKNKEQYRTGNKYSFSLKLLELNLKHDLNLIKINKYHKMLKVMAMTYKLNLIRGQYLWEINTCDQSLINEGYIPNNLEVLLSKNLRCITFNAYEFLEQL